MFCTLFIIHVMLLLFHKCDDILKLYRRTLKDVFCLKKIYVFHIITFYRIKMQIIDLHLY